MKTRNHFPRHLHRLLDRSSEHENRDSLKDASSGKVFFGISNGQLEDDVVTNIVQEPEVARKSSDDHVAGHNNRNLTL